MALYRLHPAARSLRAALLSGIAVLALLLATAGAVRAQAPAPTTVTPEPSPSELVAREAIGQLRSPYCPGLMLEVCPSPQAELLRDSIRDLAAAGWSSPQLVEWMIGRHGEHWRAVPKRSGVGLWAWVLPPAALLIGLGLLLGRLRGMARTAAEAETAAPVQPISDAERERLAAALRAWDEGEEGEP
jgi:cytochrome c-type biogenesis protein CcmH